MAYKTQNRENGYLVRILTLHFSLDSYLIVSLEIQANPMEMESHSWGRKKAVRVAGVNMVKFITLPFFFFCYI